MAYGISFLNEGLSNRRRITMWAGLDGESEIYHESFPTNRQRQPKFHQIASIPLDTSKRYGPESETSALVYESPHEGIVVVLNKHEVPKQFERDYYLREMTLWELAEILHKKHEAIAMDKQQTNIFQVYRISGIDAMLRDGKKSRGDLVKELKSYWLVQ
ncbi:hypothetical protein HYV80_03800 [Candidatus Woesearchaeota archaeon]|nr:hypothetical protein [Candidatus Woesearchaeota archaeon]